MNIGERIKQRRIDCNMSVDDLALAVNKNRATIYRYEKGDIENLPTTVIEPLADALETTPEYLMGWTDDPIDYDTLDDVWVPDEYKKLGMGVKEYLSFKKAEANDALKEQNLYATAYTEHERKVISAYRDQPDMQPAVDKILGVSAEPDYRMPVAAHNDNQSEEQLHLMREDLDEL